MAFKPVNLVPGVGKIKYLAQALTTFTAGNLIIRVPDGGYVTNAAATTANISNVEAIVTKTQTTGAAAAYIEAIPLTAVTYMMADCTNATADDQLNKSHILTDAGTVNNTPTSSASTAAVFIALSRTGASSDKKLFGYILKGPQLTA